MALATILLSCAATFAAAGCGGAVVSGVDGARRQGMLRLVVEPPDARIFVDGEYRGVVEGWEQGMVPLAPGVRLVELRASGHITQRFDVAIEPGQVWRLKLEMEPVLDGEPGAAEEDHDEVGERRGRWRRKP